VADEAGLCSHISALGDVRLPERMECELCVKMGSTWVHLRTCQTCGTTRCCDQSPNQHASKHAKESSHPVIASGQPDERWVYCFVDDAFAEW
jgi:hypothetical protein